MRPTFTPSAVPTDTPVPTNTPVPTDTPVPVPTDTPTPAAPKAVIGGDGQVNVRSGPGTAYPETGQVATGSELELVSKNAAGDWYEICCVNGQPAWIVARLVEVTGDPNLIQVAANIPAPPAPTPVPTRPAAPRPTQPPAPPAQPTQPPRPPSPPRRPTNLSSTPTTPQHQYEPDRELLRWTVQQDPRPECSADWLPDESTTSWQANRKPCPLVQRTCAAIRAWVLSSSTTPRSSSRSAEGVYRAFVVDSGGNQVSEVWELTVAGETRTFLPRWKQP